jgi:virginiamycin B lyase
MPAIPRRAALAVLGAPTIAAVRPFSITAFGAQAARLQSWPLATAQPTGIHDVAPAPDGGVWFTA